MQHSPRIRLIDTQLFIRPAKLRMPFGFGVATLRAVDQALLVVRIADDAGRTATGIAAECLLPKWFDKSAHLSDADNVAQLRRSLDIAIAQYLAAGEDTAFGLAANGYLAQQARCAEEGLNPLVASYGPAVLDRAILDAVGCLTGMSLARMVQSNMPGIDARLTPDLEAFDLPVFLAALKPGPTIALRHTVGLFDALTTADRPPDAPGDGLPVTLEEVIAAYGCRYFKLKAAGDLAKDLDRLDAIAAVLDASGVDYRCTLDGNEQYDDAEGILELWRRVAERPSTRRLAAATLFIEQPVRRAMALQQDIGALARYRPVIIDESDATLDAFPQALALGYSGVSSKCCKGFYKSILNKARVTKLNDAAPNGAPHVLTAEDLITLSGISTQQDMALVSLLGITHVERNGHHYVDGMGYASEREQDLLLQAHPDLYHRLPGHPARLRIKGGDIRLGSLDCPGFGLGVTRELLLPSG